MIWQAFAEQVCKPDETHVVSLGHTPSEASEPRAHSRDFCMYQSSVLRRVSWALPRGLVLDVAVLGMNRCEITHRLFAHGPRGEVAWPESTFPLLDERREKERLSRSWMGSERAYALRVFQPGESVHLQVKWIAGCGLARFTLDFETVS